MSDCATLGQHIRHIVLTSCFCCPQVVKIKNTLQDGNHYVVALKYFPLSPVPFGLARDTTGKFFHITHANRSLQTDPTVAPVMICLE